MESLFRNLPKTYIQASLRTRHGYA